MPSFQKLRFGSVCSGIEAASVAFAPFGWEPAWLAEVDVAASQVLAHRLGATAPVFPLAGTEKAISRLKWGDQITNWGDMTRVAEMIRSGEAEAPDVLCGGTPCQSFSVAGARRGLADERGNLALAFIQLVDVIDERRRAEGKEPCIVIFENVPGLLSSKDNAFGCFLGALAGEVLPLVPSGRKWTNAGVVLGPERAIAWRIGDAQYHGLAQRRRRIFVVASAREGFDPAAILLEFDGVRRDSPPSREAWQEVAGTLDARTDGGGFPGSDGAAQYHVVPHGLGGGRPDGSAGLDPTWWDGSPVSQTMPEKNRFPAVLQPVGYDILGTPATEVAKETEIHTPLRARTPGQHENSTVTMVVQSVAFAQNSRDEVRLINGDGSIAGALAAQAGMKQQTYVAQSVALRGRDGGATAELGGEAAYALRAANGGGSDPYVLAPIPILEAGARTGTSTTDIRAGMGVGQPGDPMFTMQSGKQHAVCVTGEITHTPKADGFDANEDGTGRGQPIVAFDTYNQSISDVTHTLRNPNGTFGDALPAVFNSTTMVVRRLMPIECHRLQGFPDGWCAVPTGPKGKIAADGPQYKQLGNSWAVNHARWVGYRIAAWVAVNPSQTQKGAEPMSALWTWALFD